MNDSAPAYSVIVPTHNRPDGLQRCLRALTQLEPPTGGHEIVVVDDGGDTPSAAVVEPIAAASPVPLHHHRQPNAGPATARNAGAALASGHRLAFTDDDCAPHPTWLTAFDAAAKADPHAMLGGRSTNAYQGNPYSEASQLLIDFLQRPGENGQPGFIASNNLCVPAERYHELGGFDTEFPRAAGEDRDLCDRWLGRGWPIHQVDAAVIDHHHRLNLRTFWRQHSNYGRGARRVWALRSQANNDQSSMGSGQTVEPENAGQQARFRFYADLVGYPLTLERRPARWAQAGLLALAQAATAWGYFQERLR